MKAVVQTGFGTPSDVLELANIEPPQSGDSDVVVSVRAASIHIGDAHMTRGVPRIMRPIFRATRADNRVPGTDFSGVVEQVGSQVSRLGPGDEVFGWCKGAFAEIVVTDQDSVTDKPENLDFPSAAAVGVSAFTALQALRDHGRVREGDEVLIVGASGGVGTFAVQLAKAFGARVTAVCSGRNSEMVVDLGADSVIDYTREDYTKTGDRYDLVLDNVGDRPMRAIRRLLTPKGKLLANGAPVHGWFGGLGRFAAAAALTPFVNGQGRPFVSVATREDLLTLADMVRSGQVRPVIDRVLPLSEAADAVAHVAGGHNRGTTVLTI